MTQSGIKEYDVVKTLRQLSANVPLGSIGTVLMIFDSPSYAFEIEFMDHGKSLDVLTVLPEDVEVLESSR
ncbi:MAG: DUF4926 domain-containing protein [Pyrinomonadaceae bacterium]